MIRGASQLLGARFQCLSPQKLSSVPQPFHSWTRRWWRCQRTIYSEWLQCSCGSQRLARGPVQRPAVLLSGICARLLLTLLPIGLLVRVEALLTSLLTGIPTTQELTPQILVLPRYCHTPSRQFVPMYIGINKVSKLIVRRGVSGSASKPHLL